MFRIEKKQVSRKKNAILKFLKKTSLASKDAPKKRYGLQNYCFFFTMNKKSENSNNHEKTTLAKFVLISKQKNVENSEIGPD